MSSMDVDVVIYGGGLCGVLAGHRCAVEGITFRIIEKEMDFGGVWNTLANEHSHLQAFEAMYRWHKDYPLGSNPLAKLSAPTVLRKLREFARDFQLYKSTLFGSVLLSTSLDETSDTYTTQYKDLSSGSTRAISAKFIMVTTGILGTQYTWHDRAYKDYNIYQGISMLAGRHNGDDSIIGQHDCTNKVVAIIGSGAFACEAMEAAQRRGAKHIYVISRPRKRWVLPFSRQFTTTFVSYVPILPWGWKMALMKHYLYHLYYKPCGIAHMTPSDDGMDYTGQCNDAFFRLAKAGKVTYIIDKIEAFTKAGLQLQSGTELHAEIIVLAGGCKYSSRPAYLADLGTGYDNLYNFAFMGPSARIGTASDFVYGFVPDGPKKQLDLFFHGIKCYKNGTFKAFQETLQPTSLPISSDSTAEMSRSSSTWFSTRAWYSNLNKGIQERKNLYILSMSIGMTWIQKQCFLCTLAIEQLKFWAISGILAVFEIFTLPVF